MYFKQRFTPKLALNSPDDQIHTPSGVDRTEQTQSLTPEPGPDRDVLTMRPENRGEGLTFHH